MASHNPNKDKKCVVLALPAYPFKPQKERSRTTKKKEAPSNNSDTGVFSGPSGERDLINVPITYGIKQAPGKFVPMDDNMIDCISGTKKNPGFTQQSDESDEHQAAVEILTSFRQQRNTMNDGQEIPEEPTGLTQQQQNFAQGGPQIPEQSTDPDNVFEFALKNSILDLD